MGFDSVRANDVAFVLKDAGTRVRAGGEYTYGIMDTQTDPVLEGDGGGAVLATLHTLLLETDSLALAIGSSLEVEDANGQWVEYEVRDYAQLADGVTTQYLLAKA